jgi:hypothetical protein
VKLPDVMDMFPYRGDRASSPRATSVLVSPLLGSLELCVLYVGPLVGPVALEEGVPSDLGLRLNGSSAESWISGWIDGFTVQPCVDALEEDNHEFELRLTGFKVGAKLA